VSDLTIKAINPFVTGDGSISPYMSGPSLVDFFNAFGLDDEYDHQGGGLPNALSRNQYSLLKLKELNGKSVFKLVLESLADARKSNNQDEIADKIHEFIKFDGYSFEKDESGIYRVLGGDQDDPV